MSKVPLFACLLFACGCAPSLLILPGDATFHHAQARYRRGVVAALTGTAAVDLRPDQALLLQADAFDRYRFDLQPPNGEAMAVQIAAATTDFAPLDFLAASSEIGNLRIQAYNAAAQLYETLLARYPASPLAPLALYRLGWAYRCVSMGGFPRGSEEAFHALLKGSPDSPLAPLARDALAVPYKTLGEATAWSILPGAGQMYVGKWGKGWLRLGVAAGFGGLALAPLTSMLVQRRLDWLGVALSSLGLVGLEVTYTTAYQDAERAALDYNEAHEAAFETAHPDAP